MVAAIARKLDLSSNAFPLALAGGALLGSEKLRDSLREPLGSLSFHPASVTEVRDPVLRDGGVRDGGVGMAGSDFKY